MIKNIFLDAGYTLVYPKALGWLYPVDYENYVNAKIFKAISETEKFRNLYASGYQYLNDNHFLKDEQEEYEVFLEFYKMILLPFEELNLTENTIKDMTKSMIYDYEKFALYSDVAPMLEKWKRGGYRLGIISDTWPSLRNIFKALGIYDYFDVFTMSSDLGVFKPNEKMYTSALNPINAKGEESIFVDDIISNLEGAEKLSIKPIQIVRSNNNFSSELNKKHEEKYPKFENLIEIDKYINEK